MNGQKQRAATGRAVQEAPAAITEEAKSQKQTVSTMVNETMDDAMALMNLEVKQFLAKRMSGEALSPDERRTLSEHIKALAFLRRDERKNLLGSEDVEDMTPEQLDEYMDRMGYFPKHRCKCSR